MRSAAAVPGVSSRLPRTKTPSPPCNVSGVGDEEIAEGESKTKRQTSVKRRAAREKDALEYDLQGGTARFMPTQTIQRTPGSKQPDSMQPQPSHRVATAGNTMKTLIVEDDFVSRTIMQEFLKQYGPSHIAVNGKEAIEAVRLALERQEPYDLICLDIMMPEVDGLQALRSIRAHEESAGLPPSKTAKIVMTTALRDFQNISDAYGNHCDAYVTKPINKAQMTAQLKKLGLIH